MAKKTIVQEIKERMREMQDTKKADLESIQQKKAEAQERREMADLSLKDATEHMDLDSYEAAKQAKRKAQTAIDMYNERYKQISQQEYISEKESDKVIESLLAYEEELTENFKEAIAEPLKKLGQMRYEYKTAIAETEATINEWVTNIHANYRSRGTTYSETGTDRSQVPVPVHRTPFVECAESAQLGNYLERFSDTKGKSRISF